MVQYWRLWQGGESGPGLLPESGGVGDQAAIMIDALQIMDAAEAELRKRLGG